MVAKSKKNKELVFEENKPCGKTGCTGTIHDAGGPDTCWCPEYVERSYQAREELKKKWCEEHPLTPSKS